MATWARKALGAVSPQNNPNGDGVRQLFGRQDLGKLPQGVQQSLLRDAALHGVDVHDSFSFVAQQSVGGRSVFVVAHSPTAKAEQRVEVMTEQGLALGQRTINLKDVDGPMQTQGGRSPSYRWPTAA